MKKMKKKPLMKDGYDTMNENENVIENTTTTSAEEYIKTIEEMRRNSVSKEEYDKLRGERNSLLQSLSRGEYITTAPTREKKDIDELRRNLAKPDQTNLEYWTNAMTLREELMEQGKPDPFIPVGRQIQASEADKVSAQKVADGIQYCIEKSGGNPALFTSYLQQITVEPPEVRLLSRKKK